MKLFQFDDVRLLPCEQIGAHTQEAWELVLLLKGAGTRTIGNLTRPMRVGELVLIPPHISHCWTFVGTGPIANVSITFPSSTLSRLVVDGAVEYHGEVKRRVTALVQEMRTLPEAFRLPRFIEVLLLLNDMSASGSAGRAEQRNTSKKRFEQFRVFCRCNYMRPITLADVATHLGMNKSAVCTFVKNHTGTTFSAYLNTIRLDKVDELLRRKAQTGEQVTICEIAYRAGFQTIPYFNTCFARRHACSPSEYITSLRSEFLMKDKG